MKLFITLFLLALLFVIGSAGMMRYFDRPANKKPADSDHRRKSEKELKNNSDDSKPAD